MLHGIVNDPTLADRYAEFECTRANVIELLRSEQSAFRYLAQTRCSNRAKFDGGLRSTIDARYCRRWSSRTFAECRRCETASRSSRAMRLK